MRSPRVALTLLDLGRRDRSPRLREDLLLRIDRLVGLPLSTAARLAVFEDVVAGITPPGFKLRPDYENCAVLTDNGGGVRLCGELYAGTVHAATIKRQLFVEQRWAYHEWLVAHGDYRSVALAPVVLGHSFGFFERIGIERAAVTAGLESGRYYWARCGFDFADPTEAAAIHQWFTLILGGLGRTINVSGVHRAYELAVVGKPTDEKASLSEVRDALGRALSLAPDPVVDQHFADVATGNGLALDDQIDLARAIFLSYPQMWSGYLDFDRSQPQRAVFDQYFQSRVRLMAR